jgi:hypothetical protein
MSLLRRSAAAALVTVVSSAALVSATATPADEEPLSRISGPSTLLRGGYEVALDRAGNRYVATGSNEVLVFSRSAKGDAAPIRVIGGARTGLTPIGLAVDDRGFVYAGNFFARSVKVHAPGANGDVPPVRTISGPDTGLLEPSGLDLGPDGSIYTTDRLAKAVVVHRANAHGNAKPLRVLHGPRTQIEEPIAVAVARDGTTYVTTGRSVAGPSKILAFAPGANGDVAPVRVLDGAAHRFRWPSGVALDPQGNVYVVNSAPDLAVIQVFSPQGFGSRPPIASSVQRYPFPLSPWGIHVAPDHSILAFNANVPSLDTYAPLVPRPKAGKPTRPGKAKATPKSTKKAKARPKA